MASCDRITLTKAHPAERELGRRLLLPQGKRLARQGLCARRIACRRCYQSARRQRERAGTPGGPWGALDDVDSQKRGTGSFQPVFAGQHRVRQGKGCRVFRVVRHVGGPAQGRCARAQQSWQSSNGQFVLRSLPKLAPVAPRHQAHAELESRGKQHEEAEKDHMTPGQGRQSFHGFARRQPADRTLAGIHEPFFRGRASYWVGRC